MKRIAILGTLVVLAALVSACEPLNAPDGPTPVTPVEVEWGTESPAPAP